MNNCHQTGRPSPYSGGGIAGGENVGPERPAGTPRNAAPDRAAQGSHRIGRLSRWLWAALCLPVAAQAATVTSVFPGEGPTNGNLAIRIAGTGFVPEFFSTGADGSLQVAATINLNADVVRADRGCPDAVNFSVVALNSEAAMLSAAPAAGQLAAGDEVLLINLQGSTSAYANVGNYEFLRVALVASNRVCFATNKTKFYGNAAGSDAGIGTNAADQKVMLQRVPNYQDVAIDRGATLTASAWDGLRGGVLAFRVNGKLQNDGTIAATGLGFRGGAKGDNGCPSYPWPTTAGDHGESYGGQNAISICDRRASVLGNLVATPKNFGGGGGGGGGTANPYRNGGGGAGGSYGGSGGNGGNSSSGERGGTAGDVYGSPELDRVFLGSGGGGGGRGVNGYGGDGGRGGGIVLVFAADLATAEGAIQATGGRGGDALIAADDGRGGGGGGSGGSILLTSGNLAMGLTNVNASGGDKGTSCTGQSLGSGGAAGTGGVGRIVVKYAGSLSGESVPAASTLQQNLGTAVSFGGTHAPAVCTNATTLVATLPPHAAGTVDVQLVESGTVVATLTNGFVYREFAEPTLLAVVPNEGGLAGGQWVTLQGVGVWSVATPYGTGTDGDVVLSGAKNLNVDGLAAGRTNADAISFSVTNLTSGSATLSAVPAAGALNVGDEVMLINLQGAAGAVSNVGRHEFLRVGLVAGNVVTFVAPKSNFYGSASGSDAGIGVAAGQQRVMLQRVPNYRNLTIGSGGTLTANAWDGTRGGVLMFRVANVFSNNGAISMAGKGYRAGPAGPALVYGYVGDSLVPYGPQQLANAYGGGGGGGYGSSSGCGGGAGGGGGYGSTGANGGSGVCGVPGGTGGAVYGAANLSLMMLGSGGGSSGDYYGGGAPSAGGAGGGAIMIAARNALGFGSLTAAGATGSGAGLDGGGGGGAGGSIRLDVEDAYLMNMTLSAGGGAGGSRSYGGLGGAGGAGRIAIYSTRASSGSSSPAASFFAIDPLNEVAHVRVDGTETAFEVLDDQRIRVLMPAHAAGVVSMSVELANGASYSLPGAYTYEPPSPVVLAGRVTSKFSGVGVDGVHVAFTGLDGVTSSNGGYFSATMPSGWSGVATPMLDDKRFVPAQAAFTNLNQSVTGLLFQIVLDDDPERGDLEYYVQTLAGLGTLTNYTIQTRHASIPVEFLNVRGGTNVAANWTPGSTNQDDRMLMVRVEGDLTIGAGATVTPAARKRGLVMYVDGDLTLNGKISMTARGAANVAGDRILVVQTASGNVYEIPAAGGAGGAAVAGDNRGGGTGGSGTNGMTGGGGAGGANNGTGNGGYPTSGAGGVGTSYSGGSGGGGAGGNSGGVGGAGSSVGGAGGAAWSEGGGGAGNPMGSGGSGGSVGTGGLLILFVRGDVAIAGSGALEANGSLGHSYVSGNGAGGGGSGGGSVNLFYQGFYANANGTNLTATGGLGGLGEASTRFGGTGGNGTVAVQSYSPLASSRKISGRVVLGATGLGAGGVALTAVGALQSTVTTATDGWYSVSVPLGWSGSIVIASDGSATPALRSYANVQTDQTGADFAWTPLRWMNPACANRILVAVSNAFTNALVDFQVELAVPYKAGMQTNFADLAVGGMNGAPLPFWVERCRAGTDAVVWVKLPALPAQASTNFYVYYGSSNAASAGNGNDVFLFFDDFADGVIDPFKWPEMRSPQYVAETNGMLKVTGVTGSTIGLFTRPMPEIVPPFALETRCKTTSAPANGWSPALLYGNAGNYGLSVLEHSPDSQYSCVDGAFTGYTGKPFAEFHRNSLIRKSATTHEIRSTYEQTTAASWSVLGSHSAYPSTVVAIGPRGDFYSYANVQPMEGWVDAIWIRKYSPSNVVATLAPAAEALTNVCPVFTIGGRVIDQKTGAGLVGMAVTSSLGTATTTNGGYYTLVAPANWSGTVAVQSDGLATPATRSYANVASNLTAQNFAIAAPMWLNVDWNCRQLVTVTNSYSGALTNYQVEIRVPYDSRMQTDFDDLRVGSLGGEAMPYWIERYHSATDAVVWVKVPCLPALGTAKFYLYFGNATATNGGNGDATFRFFDDFEDGVISTSKWPSQALGTYIAETNGELRVTGITNGTYYVAGPAITPAEAPFVLEARTRTPDVPYAGWMPISFWKSTTAGIGICDYWYSGESTGHYVRVDNTWGSHLGARPVWLYHRESILIKSAGAYSSGLYEGRVAYEDDAAALTTKGGNMTALSGTYNVRLAARTDNVWGDLTMDGRVDAVWMREYAPAEPVPAVDSTVDARTNLFATFTVSGRVVNPATEAPMAGLRVVAGATETVTANDGSYALSLPSGWTGTIVVPGDSFSTVPAGRSFTNLSASYSGQDFQYVLSPWFDTAWSARQLLVVSNSHVGALTNYQVELRIPYVSGMQTNFADLRIASTNGTALPFWIERTRAATDAVVWVKMPYLPAQSAVRLYAYYGNPAAVRGDNGNDVFLFFDDFEDGVIDPVKWPFQRTMDSSLVAAGPQITETNGHLRMTAAKCTSFEVFSGVFPTSIVPCAVECRTRTLSTPANGWSPLMVYDNATSVNGVSILDHAGPFQYSCVNGSALGIGNKPINEYHRNSVMLSASNVFETRSTFETTLSANWTNRGVYTTFNQLTVGVGPTGDFYNPSSAQAMDGQIDAIWMRQYVPTTVVGGVVGSAEALETVFPPATLSGRVVGQDTGRGVDGLRINAGVAAGLTTNGGYYSLVVPGNWSGTLAVEGDGSAVPASRTYANLTGTRTNQNFTWTPTVWQDLAWLYRRTVTVTNGMSALTNFQVGVTLPHSAGMQADFADVRVYGLDGTAWPFWVEQYGPSTSATVWVKVPVLAGNGTTRFDVYYGNQAAASAGDGDATFEFFDDFAGALNGAKWPNVLAGTATTNGVLVLDPGEGVMATNYVIAPNTIWESRTLVPSGKKSTTLRAATSPTYGYVTDGGANIVDILAWISFCIAEWNGGEYGMGPLSGNYTFSRIIYLPGFASNRVHYAVTDNGVVYSYGTHNSQNVQTNLSPVFYSSDGQTLVDWYRIRKNATNVPVAALGAEQRQEDLFTQMSIGGRVVDSTGAGVDGVLVNVSKVNAAVTTNGGYFSRNATIGWSGSVAPSHPLYDFTPLARVYGAQTGSLNGITFTAARRNPVLSGRVTNVFTGAGVAGVALNFSAGAGSLVTDADGYYSYSVPFGWAGTVTLSFTNGTFAPSPRSYADGRANAAAPWLDAAWSQRAALTVSNPNAGALTQHQVRFELPWRTGMQADFRDVRFTDAAGTALGYWIESATSGVAAQVWVKVPAVGANAATNLYLYYGNARAVGASDPEATFDFYDGFDGTVLDASKWNVILSNGTMNVVNGYLRNYQPTETDFQRIETKQSLSAGKVIELRRMLLRTDYNFSTVYVGQGTNFASVGYSMWPNYESSMYRGSTAWAPRLQYSSSSEGDLITYPSANAWFTDQFVVASNRLSRRMNGGAEEVSANYNGDVSGPLGLHWHPGGGGAMESLTDYILVRKYAAVAPVVSIGSEVNAGSTLTEQNYSWTPGPVTVSGRVTYEGGTNGVAGVVFASSAGAVATSGVDGAYSIALPYNAHAAVTPTNGLLQFAPMLRAYDGLRTDATNQNFVQLADQYQAPVFLHQGANDPVNVEGWTQVKCGSAIPAGPLQTNGVDSWMVNDNSTAGYMTYLGTPTADQASRASSQGWSLKANLLAVNTNDALDAAIDFDYSDGTKVYYLGFGSTAVGDPIVGWWNGSAWYASYTNQGGAGQYHLYDLRYIPGQGVNLYVDGKLALSGYAGCSTTLKRVQWGANENTGTGAGHYSHVSWSIGSQAVTISGRVTDQTTGQGVDGVAVNFSGWGGSTLTTNGGYYSRSIANSWTGTVAPAVANKAIQPALRNFTALTTNVPNQDFVVLGPRDLYVSLTGLANAPYTNWVDAARDLGSAIAEAVPGDVIHVYDGNYGLATALEINKAITIRSEHGPEWTALYRASGRTGIVDLNVAGAVLDGFTIRDGYRDWYTGPNGNLCVDPAPGTAGGAGVFNGATIQNCIIRNNQTIGFVTGGGLYLDNGAKAINCLVYDNLAQGTICGSFSEAVGGVRIERNSSLINCVVYGNSGGNFGGNGGVFQHDGGLVALDNCIVWGNSGANPYWHQAYSTVRGNAAADLYAMGTMRVRNSIYGSAGTIVATNSRSVDPRFVDAAARNFRLRSDSWGLNGGLDAGNPLATDVAFAPRFVGAIDVGAYENPTNFVRVVGRVTNQYVGGGVSGVTLTFSNGGGTTNTDASGYYLRVVPNGWSGTVTPSFNAGSFPAAPVSYAALTNEVRDQDIAWIPPMPVIAGRVTHAYLGSGVTGVVVTLSNGGGSAVTTNGGYYRIAVPGYYAGRATPSFDRGSFTNAFIDYTNVVVDQTAQNYQWIPPTYPLSGRIVHHYTGAGVDGVTVTLNNGVGSAVSTNGGYYSLAVYEDWSGRAVPNKGGVGTFSPVNYRDYSHVAAAMPDQDYVWVAPDPVVSGRIVHRYASNGVGGVVVAFSGGLPSATTAGDGRYSKTVPYDWTGTATPAHAVGDFTAASRSYDHLAVDAANQDFTWNPPLRTISGQVLDVAAGAGKEGVAVATADAFASGTSAGGGLYSLQVYHGWSGQVAAAYASGKFAAPTNRVYANVVADQAGQDYRWLMPRTISGRVTNEVTGAGVDGVGIQSSDGTSAITEGGGFYSLAYYQGWSGTLTPTFASGAFGLPASRTFNGLAADLADQNFSWRPVQTIEGRVVNEATGAGIDGVVVRLSTGGTATTAGGGYYSLSAYFGWSGTVTPSNAAAGAFVPATRTYASMDASLGGQDFVWRAPSKYAISGRVVSQITAAGVDGIRVGLVPGTNVLTSGGGLYSLLVDEGWSGTVVPTNATGTFAEPASRRLENVTADRPDQDFTWVPPTPAVSGRVTNHYTGAGVSGVTIAFAGLTNVATTGAGGYYTNRVPYGWSGTLAPSNRIGSFAPAARSLASVNADAAAQDFDWMPPPVRISGTVTNLDTGLGIGGARLQFGGLGETAAAADGTYAFDVYHGWTGTVAASATGATLAPTTRVYAAAVTNDKTGQNFVWQPDRTISGTITANANGQMVPGVVVAAAGVGQTVSLQDGSYSLNVPHGWTGRVTPSIAGNIFIPAYLDLANVASNVAGRNFVLYNTRTISGRVTDQYSGAGVDGVTISMTPTGSTLTETGGYYRLSVVYGYSGTVAPSNAVGSFAPPTARTYAGVVDDVGGQDFTWLPPNPIVAGRVTNQWTGAGVSGVQVQLSNGGGSSTTDAGGRFSNAVARGWSGTVVLSATGGIVTPVATQELNNVVADRLDLAFNFLPYPVISGRVTNQATAAGVAGATIVFSNGGGTKTTDAAGRYSNAVPPGWTGTVSATVAGGAVLPASVEILGLVANRANVNFCYVPPRPVISGWVSNVVTEAGQGGVTLLLSNGGGSAVTAPDGTYAITVDNNWSGEITPQVTGVGTCAPSSRALSGVVADLAGQNFTLYPPIASGDRYVSPTGSETHPYTNWSMAARSIRTALNAAQNGETIWVTNGTYDLPATLSIRKPVKLKSVQGAAATILQRGSTNAMRILELQHANADVGGFTLRGGQLAAGGGAGVSIQRGYLYNCIVRDNANAAGQAAGVQLGDSVSARIANCLVVDNVASGGSAAAIQGNGLVVNCTAVANVPAGLQASQVYNTIADGPIAATEVLYSLSPTAHAGLGNLGGDPLFVDAENGNYRLQEASAARDAGRNFYNTLPRDLDLQARILHVIDMGAYEFMPAEGLAVGYGADPNPLPQGDRLQLLLSAWNGGPNVAQDVQVQAPLPGSFQYVSNSLGTAYDPMSGTWTVGDVPAQQARDLTVWVRPTAVGYQTNVARISAAVADPAPAGYDCATNVVRVLGAIQITNLAASTSSGNSTVKWDSVVGVGYSVYTSDEPVAGRQAPAWEERATMVAQDNLRDFMDADASSAAVTRRYYQVSYTGHEPDSSNYWALIRTDAMPGYTLISPPVVTDRRFAGELGRMLAEQLNGHDGGIGSAADEVFIYQADGSWRTLYLDASKTWREEDGSASAYELPAGAGLWINRKTGTSARLTFTGPVGNAGTNAVVLQPGFNLIGLSEGKDLPLEQTLADAAPQAGADEETADQLIIQCADGSWRFLMCVTNWGAPYDGRWFDFSTYEIVPTNAVLEPGAAYYYLRRGEETTLSF